MESRKRQLSPIGSEVSETKRPREELKENVNDGDSDDSFENFVASVIKKDTVEETRKKSRSDRILVEDRDEEDYFDAPIPDVSNSRHAPVVTKKESGVNGFPCLFDDTIVVYLTVNSVAKREDCVDLYCTDKEGKSRMVYLMERWSNLRVEEGNTVNLIAAKSWAEDDFIVDNEQGVVILNPNALVPCTSVASATWCARKTVLNDKFKFGNASNKAMLLGTIMHEIFQTAITSKKRPLVEGDLLKIWSKQAPKYAEELVALSFTPNCLDSELQPYFSVICNWINKHYPMSNKFFGKREPLPSKSELLEVHDIEENIWDTRLGLKGKVDVTMRTKPRKGMESLELKTGKSNFSNEHMGQVLLYCMMHSSRYEQPIGLGNILYLKDGVPRCVTPRAAELIGILEQRNSLSVYFEDPTSNRIPAPRQESRFCEKCDHKVICSFYQKTEEKYGQSTESMKNFAEAEMSHLNQNHLEYASNWIQWISSEWKCERERVQTTNKDLWLKSIGQRVEEGNCMSNLTPTSEQVSNSQKFLISFSRNNPSGASFHPGDVCLLSNGKHVALMFAMVDHVSDDVIRVSCEKTIKTRYEAPFHLDKYTSMSTHPTTLGNLVYFLKNDEIGKRLRNVLVDMAPPQTVDQSWFSNIPPVVKKLIVKAKLNKEQIVAVTHALLSEDFVLIEGLPGSGKTTVISVLIQCFLLTKKKVLLAAFTHSAVDNILGKLEKVVAEEDILRLGSSSSIKEEVQKLTLKTKLGKESPEDYYNAVKKLMNKTSIVACTCHHVPRELLFSYRQFDVVIVDEASMVLEPLLLPVLATSTKFVLVGDIHQLKPLVISKKAKEEGAGISTMEKLQKCHPNAVQSLTSQYRMNRELSALSSKLFYADKMKCGNEAVARSSLDRNGDYVQKQDVDDHMKKVLSGAIEDSCVFLDTKSKENSNMCVEIVEGGGMINDGEAKIITELCARFIDNGVKPHEIGVMSAYRRQVEHIRSVLKNESVEVNTVDSYQGREKRVIIWSMTWTESSSKVADLLRDERRVNVALTRARQKLVVVGCRKSIEVVPLLHKFSEMLTNHVSLPV